MLSYKPIIIHALRSWARELRKNEKVESAQEARRGGGERDKDRVVLESEKDIYLGTNFESYKNTYLGIELY